MIFAALTIAFLYRDCVLLHVEELPLKNVISRRKLERYHKSDKNMIRAIGKYSLIANCYYY